MRKDIMVDIETLGTSTDSTIFQISAISFDIKTGKHHSVFNKIADIEKNPFLRVDGSTLKWWLNTNKELLTELLNSGEDSSGDLLNDFYNWLKFQSQDMKNVYLWGNGILFDNKMIQCQLENRGLEYPIFYKNDRDVRTIVDLTSEKLGITEKELKQRYEDNSLIEYNALDDVKYQVKLVVGCYNELIMTRKNL
ncbi:exonuclease-like protein [Bacillus phage Shbh1]|uniref:Exonuclease-like protein n=1 Tax=Bacillus phage Shbh1 TaxID=1796992 RepID=A0A142F182_9CAUD|nr:exonuclease-like protein [Bacillus phage Shbh1]AMQ66539.1 exonuclease-like protein [Bacillus phage Shbh1]